MVVDVLRGELVVLRPWRSEDADWYVAARDEVVFASTSERRDLTVDEVRVAIERSRTSSEEAAWAICADDGELIGSIAVGVPSDRSAEVSYFLAPAGRGRGFATDAVRLATKWIIDGGLADRVIAAVVVHNEASVAVLVRAGFVPDGGTTHPQLGEMTSWVWTAPAR